MFGHVWLFAAPWTADSQAPLYMDFSRQEYWSGLPFSSPWDLLNPVTEPTSLVSSALAGRFFTIWATREAHFWGDDQAILMVTVSLSISEVESQRYTTHFQKSHLNGVYLLPYGRLKTCFRFLELKPCLLWTLWGANLCQKANPTDSMHFLKKSKDGELFLPILFHSKTSYSGKQDCTGP